MALPITAAALKTVTNLIKNVKQIKSNKIDRDRLNKMGVPKTIAKGKDKIFTNVSAPINTTFSLAQRTKHAPKVRSLKDGSTEITHIEYISDIASSTTLNEYGCFSANLNAGESATFPWLSKQANGYEMFTFPKLKFHMESLTNTSQSGMSAMVAVGDTSLLPPASKQNFMAIGTVQRANVWSHYSYTVPTSILTRLPKYLITAALGETDTTRSMGQLFVMNSGSQANLIFGELYVEYTVRFYNPLNYVNSSSEISLNIDSPLSNFLRIVTPTTGSNIKLANISPVDGSASFTYIKVANGGNYRVEIFTAGVGIASVGILQAFDIFGNNITAVGVIQIINSFQTFGILREDFYDMPTPWFFGYDASASSMSNASRVLSIMPIGFNNGEAPTEKPHFTGGMLSKMYKHVSNPKQSVIKTENIEVKNETINDQSDIDVPDYKEKFRSVDEKIKENDDEDYDKMTDEKQYEEYIKNKKEEKRKIK
jgi:hypothetical protein